MPVTRAASHSILGGSLLAAMLLGGCVSASKYDALEAQNQDLQRQMTAQQQQATAALAASKAQTGRLAGAIKYTINSDLAFTPGGWQMSSQGKRVLSQYAAKLAPTQQNKIVV